MYRYQDVFFISNKATSKVLSGGENTDAPERHLCWESGHDYGRRNRWEFETFHFLTVIRANAYQNRGLEKENR